jgi:hypothetical protein
VPSWTTVQDEPSAAGVEEEEDGAAQFFLA